MIVLEVVKPSDYLKTAGVGTLVYTAPEVYHRIEEPNNCGNKCPYDNTVDIYSLSLVLHEIFGGHGGYEFFPCPGIDHRVWDFSVHQAKLSGKPPRLQELPIRPKTLQNAIGRGVDADPQKRPTLKEFSEAIEVTCTQ